MELKNYVIKEVNKFNSFKNEIPLPIRLFLGKAVLFFVVWRIVYSMFLYDSKFIDYKLTTHVAEASTFFLNNSGFIDGFTTQRRIVSSVFEGETIKSESSVIYHNNKGVLYIADACNGLQLMVLYIGFIVCMPSSFLRKVLYVALGILVLDIVNILRCMGLIYLREYFHAYFDFAHHYLFKAIVYFTTFLFWRLFARKIQLKNEVVQI